MWSQTFLCFYPDFFSKIWLHFATTPAVRAMFGSHSLPKLYQAKNPSFRITGCVHVKVTNFFFLICRRVELNSLPCVGLLINH